MTYRIPEDSKRCTILGRTGSGKTLAAGYQLSQRSWTRMPWVIIDSKGDGLIRRIKPITLSMSDPVPRQPGLYRYAPVPGLDDEAMGEILRQIWSRGKTGLYLDEGYMVSKQPFMDAVYTQGRSKKIPVISLFQRPVWMNRFAVSECDYYQIFHIADRRDRKTVNEYAPGYDLVADKLAPYHSMWYDVGRNYRCVLTPCPDESMIEEIFWTRKRREMGPRWI